MTDLQIVREFGPDPVYLKCKEVAARWRCSLATVYRRVNDGTLDTVGQGSLLRVSSASVTRYEQATSAA